MKRKAGGSLLTSKQVQKLDGDWELIQVVCSEAKKAQKLVEKTADSKRFPKSKIIKSLNLMKKHHKQVKSSFRQKSTVLQKLSPRCSDHIQSKLKSYDNWLENMIDEINPWPYGHMLSLLHFGMSVEDFAKSYKNFGVEVKMYRDLVKNARKSVVE